MAFWLRGPWRPGTRQSDIAAAWKRLAEHPDFKLVLHDLANRYHILTPHDGGERSEGQREVVLYVYKQVNLTADELSMMEAVEREAGEET